MRCRALLYCLAGSLLCAALGSLALDYNITKVVYGLSEMVDEKNIAVDTRAKISKAITIFMCGDVMTGRGIDQILPHPGDPTIHESYMKTARGYVEIAEKINGPIDYPVGFSYIWGDALGELDRVAPDVKLINLETSVTKSDDYWKGKGIHYRMHPQNVSILTAAGLTFVLWPTTTYLIGDTRVFLKHWQP